MRSSSKLSEYQPRNFRMASTAMALGEYEETECSGDETMHGQRLSLCRQTNTDENRFFQEFAFGVSKNCGGVNQWRSQVGGWRLNPPWLTDQICCCCVLLLFCGSVVGGAKH